MRKEDCFYLGKIIKNVGLDGAVVLTMDVDTPSHYANLQAILLDIQGKMIPFIISKIRLNNNKATLFFEDMKPEETRLLIGKEAYLPMEMLPKLEGNKFYFHEIKGFAVEDEEKGNIGYINDVLEYPGHPLFQIMNGENEILIPIINPVIKKVDRTQKTIYINAPVGLIDLYL